MCISAAIGAAGSIGGALIGAQGASRAGNAQLQAANAAAAVQREMFYQNREDMMPAIDAGNLARQAYMSHLGLGEAPEGYGGFEATPNYQFMVDEAMKSNNRAAAAAGRLDSGSTRKSAMRYGNALAAGEYNNHLNRLAGGMASGSSTANALAGLGAASAANQGSAILAGGAGRASGYMGQANALGQGLTNLAGVASGYFGGR